MPENEFLTDDKGHWSAVRLMALISLLAGIALSFLAVFLDSDRGCWMAITLIGAAFTGKVAQKQIEKTPDESRLE